MLLFILISFISSDNEFQKCSDMRFCSQNINQIGEWSLDNFDFDNDQNEFSAKILNHNKTANLRFFIYLMQNNSFRIHFTPIKQENVTRYNLSENLFILNQNIINQHLPLSYKNLSGKVILNSTNCKAEINLSPFYITISDKYNSILYINFNQNLIYENNIGTTTGIDFSFKDKKTRISGFSEFLNSINMDDSKDEPNRISNVDRFSDYGHVPLIHGHSSNEMASLFWLNPTDTFLKISTDNDQDLRNVRILSEGGNIDIVVFTGNIFDILNSYSKLTGNHDIPPIFSIGLHQLNNRYETQYKVEKILDEFDNNKLPFDSLWLNEKHYNKQQPFSFNLSTFPDPNSLFQKLSGRNRFLVKLNVPYLPEDVNYIHYKYAKEHDYFVKESDGKTPFKGTSKSGQSFWPDFLNPEVHKWWNSLYQYKINESASNVYYWNDMNEPTVVSEVERTFPKENVYFGGYEFREVRNLYGLLMDAATYEGVVNRNSDKNLRPFILSRSFFAGSQKYSLILSGENEASFDHLRKSISMSIVSGLCGIPLSGSYIGGFNGEPTLDLISRWLQVGIFGYPLFVHNFYDHFSFNNLNFELLMNATKSRYEAAPLWYTSIQISHETGVPPVLPLFALFPEDENLHDIEDQFIVGQSLMVAPILEENAKEKRIVKPPGIWYNLTDGQKLTSGSTFSIEVFNHSLPLFVRGGTIVPFYKEVGMNMEETMKSPLKLVVACDEDGNARCPFYIDDGISFNYKKGEFLNRWIIFENNRIRIEAREPFEKSIPSIVDNIYVNEIVFYGLKSKPEKIGDESVLDCSNESEICTMKQFKLYLKNTENGSGDDDEKLDKKNLYTIIICCSIGIFLVMIAAVACIVVCHLKPKKRNIDDDKMNFENILDDDYF